ncbi:MAG: PEP-CTERM sorting domain-containing protein [Pirellulales bacterium]
MTRQTLKLAALLALLLVAAPSTVSQAANSWTVSISEKQLKLENPTDMMWDKWLMWDLGYQRMMDRNMPYVELLNNSESTSPITEFHLTIGDNRFNFGNVENSSPIVLGSTTPGFSLTGSTINTGDELVVSIGNGGLLPGQLVRFKINLDVDPAYAATYAASFGASQPDFRTILFDMNGRNVYDGTTGASTDDNAEAFVVFNPGGQSSKSVFQDEDVAAGQYFNNNLRQYRASDPVLIFQLGGVQVPEPTSVALVVLGLAAGIVGHRSRH